MENEEIKNNILKELDSLSNHESINLIDDYIIVFCFTFATILTPLAFTLNNNIFIYKILLFISVILFIFTIFLIIWLKIRKNIKNKIYNTERNQLINDYVDKYISTVKLVHKAYAYDAIINKLSSPKEMHHIPDSFTFDDNFSSKTHQKILLKPKFDFLNNIVTTSLYYKILSLQDKIYKTKLNEKFSIICFSFDFVATKIRYYTFVTALLIFIILFIFWTFGNS